MTADLTAATPCAGLTDLYYSDDADDQALAAALCAACPLAATCLAGALERREPDGVWGGLTSSDRRTLIDLAKGAT